MLMDDSFNEDIFSLIHCRDKSVDIGNVAGYLFTYKVKMNSIVHLVPAGRKHGINIL